MHVSKSRYLFQFEIFCSNLLDMRNLQEQVKKAFCYQKLFWPFTAWINCSSDLKYFANSRLSAYNFKIFTRSVEQFFLTVSQNNFGNKIPFMLHMYISASHTISIYYVCQKVNIWFFMTSLKKAKSTKQKRSPSLEFEVGA